MEITLSYTGAAVWADAEWQELDEDGQRRQATLLFWRADAHAFGLLAENLRRDEAAIAEGSWHRGEWKTRTGLQALITEADGGHWASLLSTSGDASTHVILLEDLVIGYRVQAEQMWRQVEDWRLRAEDEQEWVPRSPEATGLTRESGPRTPPASPIGPPKRAQRATLTLPPALRGGHPPEGTAVPRALPGKHTAVAAPRRG
ncbi:hypothetical protein [Nocardiopsis synnemataformans]|uniref:hypothetical protein n=1 Tax=Nocardiopsis synnemataformans TaxID=61305 RepID=UPI003EC14AEB